MSSKVQPHHQDLADCKKQVNVQSQNLAKTKGAMKIHTPRGTQTPAAEEGHLQARRVPTIFKQLVQALESQHFTV